MKVFYLFALIILTIACWQVAGILWGFRFLSPGWLIVLAIVAWLFVSALTWAARRVSERVWIYAGLLILAGLFLPASLIMEIFPDRWSLPFDSLMALTLFLIASIALVMAALLFYSGLNLYKEWRNVGMVEGGGSQAQRKQAGKAAVVVLVLGALLLTKTLHNLYWLMVWDTTYDSIGYLWLVVPVLAVLFSGVVLSIALPGRTKLAGLLYSLLIPALMVAVSARAQRVDFCQLTEERAGRVSQAIESYYAREGRYPQNLRQLTPWYSLSLPGPVIIYGQGWCYDGGNDYYRLGYVYREHWSDPRLIGRIYKTKGEVPDLGICDEEIAALQTMYYEHDTAPTEKPLPTSVVPIPRTPVQPLVRVRSITRGTWSVDGKYLVFGVLDTSEVPPSTTLNFLNAETGHICQADERYPSISRISNLRRQYAWLPDGRLLFISEEGEMDLLRPCEAGRERLADRYPAKFSQVAAYEGKSGRILLKSEQAYWILDGDSLEARQVPGVSPNPYEFHWDNYAWSPGGERLAISRLNGRDREAGSTLYLVAGGTGEVMKSLPLEYAFDQSAPWVEWLTKDELLLHSEGVLAMVDFRSDPPRIVNVLKDIFALDIAYPEEISSMAPITDKAGESYHLAVRVNHPRNQDLYLYHSETGSVEVLRHEVNTILFFPDGEWTGLWKWEDTPTYRDEYELVWVDTPGKETGRLVVQGHTPRNYPTLFARYLPRSSQMAFSSSQGISLVSVPDGELLRFWELAGAEGSRSTHVLASPDEKVLVAMADGVGLYFIPLP